MNGGYGFHASTVERRGRFVVACERYLSRTLPTRAPAARIRLLLTVNGDETWLTTRRKRIPPVGESTMISSERGLAAILWEGDNPKRVRLEPQREDPNNDILVETERQLKSYFDGTLKVFSVPLDFVGTEFQTTVWKALLNIPFGQTRTYTQIAKQIGRPTAARAVGAAQREKPDLDHGSLPSRHRRERRSDWLRRRSGHEGTPARARAGRGERLGRAH